MCIMYSSSLYGRLVSQKIPERSRTGGFLLNSSGVRAGTSSSSVPDSRMDIILSFCAFTCFFILCFCPLSMPCRIRIRSRSSSLIVYNGNVERIPRRFPDFLVSEIRKVFSQHFLVVHLRAFDSIPLPAWTLSDSISHFHGIQ